jgi:hypothetical protein
MKTKTPIVVLLVAWALIPAASWAIWPVCNEICDCGGDCNIRCVDDSLGFTNCRDFGMCTGACGSATPLGRSFTPAKAAPPPFLATCAPKSSASAPAPAPQR